MQRRQINDTARRGATAICGPRRTTDNIADDNGINSRGTRRKALHCAAFRECRCEPRMRPYAVGDPLHAPRLTVTSIMSMPTLEPTSSRGPGRCRARAGGPRGRLLDPWAIALFATVISAAWACRPSLWFDEGATISASASRTLPELWKLLGHIDAVHGAVLPADARLVRAYFRRPNSGRGSPAPGDRGRRRRGHGVHQAVLRRGPPRCARAPSSPFCRA